MRLLALLTVLLTGLYAEDVAIVGRWKTDDVIRHESVTSGARRFGQKPGEAGMMRGGPVTGAMAGIASGAVVPAHESGSGVGDR
jgi:hypothetical protein